ncbi:MAG TPA: ATP-binding protein [Anaerolineae bacterium]|nr:ATP-binding protein [Anaerolineae bacterium]HMR64036.1 ATP-binding protein [Anaerolineae bacterium]
MTGEQTLSVAGEFSSLVRITDWVGQVAAQAGLDEKATYAVQMAVDEACTNIIEHAYGGESQNEIRLSYRLTDDRLQVIILDHGAPFDPTQPSDFDPQAPLAERRSRGMGLFLIQNLVDHLAYASNLPDGNQLTLTKIIKKTQNDTD